MVIPGMGFCICFCWDGPYLLEVSGVLELLHYQLNFSPFTLGQLQIGINVFLYSCMQLPQIIFLTIFIIKGAVVFTALIFLNIKHE